MATITRSFQITKPIKLFEDTTIPLDNITIAGLADFMQGKIALGYSFDYIVLLGKANIKIDVEKISLWRGKLSLSIQCSNLKITNALGGSYAMLGRINLNVSCIAKNDLSEDYYSIIGNGTSRDAFNNFEPLVSGDGLLNENTFSISDEDLGEDTPNFQQYVDNGFTVPIQLPSYMVGERRQALTGCKIGTVPKAGDIHIRDSGTEPVKIWLQEDGVYCRTGRRKSTSIGYDWGEKRQVLDNPVTRLGLVMVGGGGNGGSANTVDRQGYNNGRMIAPGTSGGGGGIIWGVLNLEKSSEDKPYIIFVNATESDADSADGSTTTLAYNLDSLPWWLGDPNYPSSKDSGLLAQAYGGGGGKEGNVEQPSYGKGGIYKVTPYAEHGKDWFKVLGNKKGEDGIGYSAKSTSANTNANNFTIKFFDTGEEQHETRINNEELHNSGSVEDIEQASIPGGNSFGNGADVVLQKAAGYGGGGAGVRGTLLSLRHGGKGYWAIYY